MGMVTTLAHQNPHENGIVANEELADSIDFYILYIRNEKRRRIDLTGEERCAILWIFPHHHIVDSSYHQIE